MPLASAMVSTKRSQGAAIGQQVVGAGVMRLHGVNLGVQLKSAGLILDRLEELAAVGEPTGRDVRGQPDVGVMASRGDDELAVLVWHYHDDDVAGPDATVHLELTGLPRGTPTVTHFRIDEQHSNAYAAWRRRDPAWIGRDDFQPPSFCI